MNDVPVSYTYRTISKGLQDSFLKASICKRGWTFYKFFLGVRIDYIFVSDGLKVADAEVIKCEGSDHFPYKTTLRW